MAALLADRSYVLLDGYGEEVARWTGIDVPVYDMERPNVNATFRYWLRVSGRAPRPVQPGPLAAMVYRAMLELELTRGRRQ